MTLLLLLLYTLCANIQLPAFLFIQGESEAEYEQNLAGAVCAVQLKKGLNGISKEDMSRVAIA